MASLSFINKLAKGTNTQLWSNSSAIDMCKVISHLETMNAQKKKKEKQQII